MISTQRGPSSNRGGVEFKGEVIDSGVCWQLFFEDPDGNRLAIHHRYEGKG